MIGEVATNFIYRRSIDSDLSEILAIWDINIRREYEIDELTLGDYHSALINLFETRNEHCDYWVAVDEKTQKIIGWQSFFPIFYTPLKKGTSVESSTYIHPDYQKTGVAFQLMKFAIAELSNSKINFVYGFVNKHNLGAIKLVNKIGFMEIGTVPEIPSLFPYYYEKILFIYVIQ